MHHITAGIEELQFQQEDHLVRSFGVRGARTCTARGARPESWAAFWCSAFAGPLLQSVSCQYSCPRHSISVLLKSLRQGAIDIPAPCRHKGQENLLLLQTVPQLQHQVSWVSAPWEISWTQVSFGLSFSAVPSYCHFLISHFVSSLPAGCPCLANNLNIHKYPAACSYLRDCFRVSTSKCTSLVQSH